MIDQPKRVRFAQLLFAGQTGVDAAISIGYKRCPSLKQTVRLLRRHPDVVLELARLKKESAKVAKHDRMEWLELLWKNAKWEPPAGQPVDPITLRTMKLVGLHSLVQIGKAEDFFGGVERIDVQHHNLDAEVKKLTPEEFSQLQEVIIKGAIPTPAQSGKLPGPGGAHQADGSARPPGGSSPAGKKPPHK